MQHFKLVYDVLTDSRNKLSARDFSKSMSRYNVNTGRKRVGADKSASAPRGVILTWWVVPIMLAVGFVTPWPYNYWRLKKFNEACH